MGQARRAISRSWLRPLLGHAGRDHLLGQDVESGRGRGRAVEDALAHPAQERGRFDQLVQGQREEPALGCLAQRVTGSADALEERRDRTGGPDLDHQVHVADVDPELQRRRGHDRAQAARLQPFLGVQPSLAREAAMVAGHLVFAQQLRELGGDALRHLSRVHEDEGGAMRPHQLGDALVDLGPLLVRAHRAQR